MVVFTHNIIVDELKREFGDDSYKLLIYPTVHSNESDHWRDKKADYSVIKIQNARTCLVMELKLGVFENLFSMKDVLAQAFLEVSHAVQRDTLKSYKTIACVVSDTSIYHIFLLHVRHKPFSVEQYYSLR